MEDAVLRAEHLKKYFGAVAATDDVSFELRKGEILGLIGPNGAGKTTLVDLLTGVEKPSEGYVEFDDTDITGRTPHRIGKAGLARTFQIVRPFSHMTVRDNVTIGALFGHGQRKSMGSARERADEVLEMVELDSRAHRSAASLTPQETKRLELAKALAADPTVLLLDEVMAGLHATEIDQAVSLVRRVNESGVAVLVIEHVMKAIVQLCDRVIVLETGSIIAEGDPEEVTTDPEVIKAYLGERWAKRIEDGEDGS